MTQKSLARLGAGGMVIAAAAVCFAVFGFSSATAQVLPTVGAASVDVDKNAGTPVGAIISAAANGGLSASQNLVDIVPEPAAPTTTDAPISSAQTAPEPAKPAGFNPDSIDYLESQGGLSTNPMINAQDGTVFKLAITFFDKVVFRKDVQFANRPTFNDGMDISGAPTFDKDTAGYAIIKKGSQSVVVDFDQAYDAPPVVTASLSLEQYDDPDVRAAAEDLLLVSDVKYIVANVTKKGFEIMMDRKADSDIPFSWHALAVKDPKISKKKGEILDSSASSGLDASSPPASARNSRRPNNAATNTGPAAVNQPGASASPTPAAGDNSQNQTPGASDAGTINP